MSSGKIKKHSRFGQACRHLIYMSILALKWKDVSMQIDFTEEEAAALVLALADFYKGFKGCRLSPDSAAGLTACINADQKLRCGLKASGWPKKRLAE